MGVAQNYDTFQIDKSKPLVNYEASYGFSDTQTLGLSLMDSHSISMLGFSYQTYFGTFDSYMNFLWSQKKDDFAFFSR